MGVVIHRENYKGVTPDSETVALFGCTDCDHTWEAALEPGAQRPDGGWDVPEGMTCPGCEWRESLE